MSSIVLITWILLASIGCQRANHPAITQDELVRRTQELVDSVAGGDQSPFQKYFAEDSMFFDERGENMNKKELVASITPLPKGYSGMIKVAKAQSHIDHDVAILSYDLNETETVFGQNELARYHETDTWMRRNGQWQIVAGQVLRYYEDPAPGEVDPRTFKDYLGTYQLGPERKIVISQEGGQLFRQGAGADRATGAPGNPPKTELIPEAQGIFFRKGVEGRLLFHRGPGGKVDTLIDRRNNEDVVWKKVS
ncbi:MAG: DUF4440 domain-containing protein [Terriglobales bacterium]